MNSGKKITMEEAKVIRLEILKELDSFCSSHNIRYYLAFGTLIGAIRHNGYIPWDDDVDVWMPRPDLDKFMEEYHSDGKYKLSHNRNPSDEHMWGFARLIDTRTTMKLGSHSILGVNVELYPLDGFPEEGEKRNNFVRNLKYLRAINSRMIVKVFGLVAENKWPFKKIKLRVLQRFINYYTKFGSKYSYNESVDVVAIFDTPYKLKPFKRDWFGLGIKHKFETLELMVPVKFHEVLTTIYGDYMTPPPIEEQVPSHNGNYYWI